VTDGRGVRVDERDACASPSVKDVEGLVPTSPAYPFHPNQVGQQVMAGQVLAALGR
jgi:hypothetical protein